MPRHAALFVANLFLISQAALSAVTEIPVKGGEKILISVPAADFKIHGQSGKVLRVNLNAEASEDFALRREGNQIRIEPKEASQNGFLTKPSPKKHVIEISGPSLNLEIHAFEGQIHLNKWNKEALLHLQKGHIVSRDGSGSLIAHAQTGEIEVFNHQGRLEVDSYKANISVQNLNGDADLESFLGETEVNKAKGFLSLNQGQGSSKITDSSGTLQFELAKGILNVRGFQGRVEGQTQEGPVNVSMSTGSEINIRSQNARVTVHADSKSGAYLNLATVEGQIYVPNYLRVSRDGSQKYLKGRLKGESRKGSVLVRSQEGVIVIR